MANCPIRWILYLAWIKAAPDVAELHRLNYTTHLDTCPTCRAEIDGRKDGPANPELTIEEIGQA